MTLSRFSIGLVLASLVGAVLVIGCNRLRHRLLPAWTGPLGWLADLVLAMAAFVVTGELLGTVGLLRPSLLFAGIAVAGLVAGGGARLLDSASRPVPEEEAADETGAEHSRSIPRLAGIAGLVVLIVAPWVGWSLKAIDRGMTSVDTLWYHLPMAARFAQTGHVGRIQFFDSDPVTAYFPGNSELIHTAGILALRTDIASTFVDLGWLVVALTAAWAIGRSRGVAVGAMLAASLAVASPTMTSTQAGTALTDIVGLALLLTSIAMLLHGRGGRSSDLEDAMAALAIGLAAGTKFTFLIPAAAICVGLIATSPAGHRLRRALVVFAASAVGGGYWYLRNLLAVGNPLPSLNAHVGPIGLPNVEGDLPTSTVAHFLFSSDAWSRYFVPGFENTLGPLWMVIWLMALAGMAGAVFQRDDRRLRVVGVTGVVSTIGWLATPQYLVVGGQPFFFEVNVRYCLPALAIGLVLLPMVLTRVRVAVFGLIVVNVVVAQIQPVSWPVNIGYLGDNYEAIEGSTALWGVITLAAATLVGSLIWAGLRHSISPQRSLGVTVALAPIAIVAALLPFHGAYLRDRYVGARGFGPSYEWARGVHGSRIAVLGPYLQLQYPYAGLDISNHVQYLGTPLSDGGFRTPKNCRETIETLNRGRYDYFVSGPVPAVTGWMKAQPGVSSVLTETSLNVWRLPDPSIRPNC